MKRYAVVDIGTNSARLMIAHIEQGTIIAEYKTLRLIRVGEDMVGQGHIVDAAMVRTRDALNDFLEISKQHGVDRQDFFCFGTSAVRDANNAQDFMAYLKTHCGVMLDIVSGDKEALLGFAGCIDGQGGMFDIGGGSTEVMLGSLDDVHFQHSYRIGTVRMLQMFPSGDEADPHAFAQAHALAAKTFENVPKSEGFAYTAIGGTATALAALDIGLSGYDAKRIQGHVISLESAQSLCAMLESRTKQQRKEIIGLEEKKADVIVFGAILFVEFMKAVNAKTVTVSDSDNQEGYLKFKLGLIESHSC